GSLRRTQLRSGRRDRGRREPLLRVHDGGRRGRPRPGGTKLRRGDVERHRVCAGRAGALRHSLQYRHGKRARARRGGRAARAGPRAGARGADREPAGARPARSVAPLATLVPQGSSAARPGERTGRQRRGRPGARGEGFVMIPTGVPLQHTKIAAFGMTRHAGGSCADDANCRALVDAETPVVTLVGKSSTLHVDRVLRTTRDENLRMIAESVTHFKRMGKEVIFDAEHFFDGYRLDPGYALATLGAAADAGADWVVLCDTNGGALPTDVEARVWEVRDHITAPLGIHPHNDSGLALANALAAVEAGCVQVQGTINGYGERCGNLDLVQLIATLQLKLGYQVLPPECLRELRDAAHFVAAI